MGQSSNGDESFLESVVKTTVGLGLIGGGGSTFLGGPVGSAIAGQKVSGSISDIGTNLTKGIKDVTGATAAEEANKLARQQFEDQKAQASQARQDAQIQNYRNELNASNLAAAGRKSSGSNQYTNKLGSDERDFLGL